MSVGPMDPRLEDLPLEWEERRERGDYASVESLCPGDPELAAELGRRIEALCEIDSLIATHEPLIVPPLPSTRHTGPGSPGTGPRASAACASVYRDLLFHAGEGLGEVFLAAAMTSTAT